MAISAQASRVVACAVWMYRRLLRAYPGPFRHEYGDQMLQAFRGLCQDAYEQGGVVAALFVWRAVLCDWVISVAGEHRAFWHQWASEGEVEPGLAPIMGRRALRFGVVAGVLLAFALVIYGFIAYPTSVDADTPMTLIVIGGELALYGVAAWCISRRIGPAELRAGVLSGLGVGGLWTVYLLPSNLLRLDSTTYHVLSTTALLGSCALFLTAGLLSRRKGGHVESSIRTGALAALIGMLILVISLFLSTYPFMDHVVQMNLTDPGFRRSGMHDVVAWTIQDNLGGTFYMLLFGSLFGVGLGGLGGLLRTGRAPIRDL